MIEYSVKPVDRNGDGRMLRCPHCGQALCVVNAVEGISKVTVMCRRCKRFTEITSKAY